MIPETKDCPQCKITKPSMEFYVSKGTLATYCKACIALRRQVHPTQDKVCPRCKKLQGPEEFIAKRSRTLEKPIAARTAYNICNTCRNTYNKSKYAQRYPDHPPRRGDIYSDAYWVWIDCRQSDRKHNRQNDLDLAFVETETAKPCEYCGETTLRRGLDRKDNTQGHFRANVVVACARCNYFRRDMPYLAWLLIVPAMRQAREQGLFGHWEGRHANVGKRKTKPPTPCVPE